MTSLHTCFPNLFCKKKSRKIVSQLPEFSLKTPITAVRRSAEECQEKVVEKKIFSGNEATGCKCTGIGDDVLPSVVRPLIRNEKSGHVYVPALLS